MAGRIAVALGGAALAGACAALGALLVGGLIADFHEPPRPSSPAVISAPPAGGLEQLPPPLARLPAENLPIAAPALSADIPENTPASALPTLASRGEPAVAPAPEPALAAPTAPAAQEAADAPAGPPADAPVATGSLPLDPPALPRAEPAAIGIGASAAAAAATIAPYRFSAERSAGQLRLTGSVPSEEARAELARLIRSRFFQERIIDETRLGDGAPAGFGAMAAYALEQLSQLAAGEAALSGTSLRLSGESLYAETAERMRGAIAGAAPAGWRTVADIKLRGDGGRRAELNSGG